MNLKNDLVQNAHRNGIVSVCSSNHYVVKAAIVEAMAYGYPLLIESTANQVNQYGGYTGLTPSLFREYVMSLARDIGMDQENIVFGGDHLGPLIWSNLPESEALPLAEILVREYVAAGFQKIHIDTSMKLKDDNIEGKLDDLIIARRAARLIAACENERKGELIYVIGSEVPIPGGATSNSGKMKLTSTDDLEEQLRHFHSELSKLNLEHVFSSIVGVVVQPGVEFGDDEIIDYDRDAAKALREFLSRKPTLSYEGHSTDYQLRELLRAMVEDGIRILKVGPALTFAFRQAVYNLERIEREFKFKDYSNIRDEFERVMLENPEKWVNYYQGTDFELRQKRHYSFCDRIRYYAHFPAVTNAMKLLLRNLSSVKLPLSLLSEFFPNQYHRIRRNEITPDPENLIIDRIRDYLRDYTYAIIDRG